MPVTESKQLPRAERTIVNLATSAIAWGWPILLMFITAPVIVQGLGPDAYGIRGLVTSIIGYFALLDLGLNGAVTKYLAEYRVQDNKPLMTELLGTTLTTYTILGLFGGILIWLLAEWFTTKIFIVPPEFYTQSVWAFRLTGVGFFLSMITWWGSSIPTGIQRFDVFNGISIGFGTITTLGSVTAVLMGYGLIGVVIANVLSNVIAVLAYWIAIRKLMPDIVIRFSFDRAMFKRTVLFGLYMVAFRIFSLLFYQLDIMLIGALIGAAAVTFYIIPQSIAQVIHGINGNLMQIIFPMASEFSATGDRQKLERLFFRGFNLCMVAGLAAAVPLAVVAEPLLRFWMSPEIAQQSTLVLELLIVTFFLFGLTALTTSFLGGINLPQFVMYGPLVSGVSGMIFYAALIKLFGIKGAALGKLLSVALTVAYYIVVCKWMAGISVSLMVNIVFRTLGMAVGVGSIAYLIATPLIVNLFGVILAAAIIAATYAGACWVLGVFDTEEKRSLIKIIGRLVPITRSK